MAADLNTVCAQCKRPFGQHFEITRYDARRVARSSVKICSAICLIRWAADFTTQRGTQAVSIVQGIIAQLTSAVRGPRG